MNFKEASEATIQALADNNNATARDYAQIVLKEGAAVTSYNDISLLKKVVFLLALAGLAEPPLVELLRQKQTKLVQDGEALLRIYEKQLDEVGQNPAESQAKLEASSQMQTRLIRELEEPLPAPARPQPLTEHPPKKRKFWFWS